MFNIIGPKDRVIIIAKIKKNIKISDLVRHLKKHEGQ